MKKLKNTLLISTISLLLFSCNDSDNRADGYGNFEATEIDISAENNGKLQQFKIKEGEQLEANVLIGYIDTNTLSLKREQLAVAKEILYSKSNGVLSQIDVLRAKLKNASTNKKRIENLIKDNAGTTKQLDDINGEIEIIKQQIRSIEIQNASVVNEVKSINVQVKQLQDQIQKSKIINPLKGTVLAKYAELNELVSFGKPLYKIADLSEMVLRVYVSEKQLASIPIGMEVKVKIDAGDDLKTYKGTVSWIADQAEFTPKIIQTKEERVALVYAVKVNVKNDGSLKIGLPAEMWISNND